MDPLIEPTVQEILNLDCPSLVTVSPSELSPAIIPESLTIESASSSEGEDKPMMNSDSLQTAVLKCCQGIDYGKGLNATCDVFFIEPLDWIIEQIIANGTNKWE